MVVPRPLTKACVGIHMLTVSMPTEDALMYQSCNLFTLVGTFSIYPNLVEAYLAHILRDIFVMVPSWLVDLYGMYLSLFRGLLVIRQVNDTWRVGTCNPWQKFGCASKFYSSLAQRRKLILVHEILSFAMMVPDHLFFQDLWVVKKVDNWTTMPMEGLVGYGMVVRQEEARLVMIVC